MKKKDGEYLSLTGQEHVVSDDQSFKALDSRAAMALATLAAVDFDGDGVDELSVYTPYYENPSVTLFRQKEDGDGMSLEKIGEIPLKDLNVDSDPWQFDRSYGKGIFPVVRLQASSLA